MKKYLPVLIVFASSALRAQSGELWFSGGASILSGHQLGSPSSDGKPADVLLFNGYRFGLRFAFNSAGHFGHEIQYAYNRTDLRDNTGLILADAPSAGTAIHQGGYNLLYYFPANKEGSKTRPFVTGGFQLSDFVLPAASAPQQGSSVRAGGNVGAGVKVRISPLFALRVDLREYFTGKPNWNGLLVNQKGLLYQTEISTGFGVCF
jgi:hypothetical protein